MTRARAEAADALWLTLLVAAVISTTTAHGQDAGVEAAPRETDGGLPADARVAPIDAPAAQGAESAGASAPPATAPPAVTREPAPAPREADARPQDRWADTHVDAAEGATSAPELARGWAEEPGYETEDGVLLIPRIVLFVPKLVITAVFWPIVGLLEVVEREKVIPFVENLLYWNDAHTAGLFPAISYLSSAGFTYGGTLFHDDLFGHDEAASMSARYGGRFSQGYEVSFDADRVGGSRMYLEAVGRYEVAPGQEFAGIGITDADAILPTLQGPRDTQVRTRYRQERVLAELGLGYTSGTTGSILKLGGYTIFNRREFGPSEVGGRSIEEVYDTARIPAFDGGATVLELGLSLQADGRDSDGLNATGARLELFGGATPPIQKWSYWHFGAELSWVIDLYRRDRLLALRAALEAAHAPLDEIPFTSLPRLGGADRVRGYREDQFRDRRMALASVEYRYPIHSNIQGALFVDAGYVAPLWSTVFESVDAWKVGYGGGLLIGDDDSVLLRLELAYGDGLHFFVTTDVAQAFDGRSTEL